MPEKSPFLSLPVILISDDDIAVSAKLGQGKTTVEFINDSFGQRVSIFFRVYVSPRIYAISCCVVISLLISQSAVPTGANQEPFVALYDYYSSYLFSRVSLALPRQTSSSSLR